MDKLYPIVRRVRRPLLPPEDEPQRRRDAEGTCVPATALRTAEAEQPSEQSLVTSTATEQKVSGETPATTAETAVVPETTE